MIQFLEWDSNFFGCKIGKLDYTGLRKDSFKFEDIKSFDLVYIFSDEKLDYNKLFDVKIKFQKLTEKKNFPNKITEFDSSKHSYEELLDLAYLSGHDSRFLKDPFFGEKAFKNLYKAWIDKSIEDHKTKILIYFDQNRIIGFVTYKKDIDNAVIELIAVSENTQGKGIGFKLISAVEANLNPSTNLFVSTQETNNIAMEFYVRNGFRIFDKKYIYHYAKNTL